MMEENRTLLIVDDEPEALKGYTEFLNPQTVVAPRKSSRRLYGTGSVSQPEMEKYTLLLAQSGEEAIQLMQNELKQKRRVAAGFFDVKLGGGMDGLATIHAVKALDPGIHCVVVTAYHDRTVDEIHQIFGEDFKDQWDYLNKPFTQGEIVQKARQMVAAWNRKAQLEKVTQALVQSERLAAVGQVARGVGHEFGNILLRIMGKIDLALMEKDPIKVTEHLKVALAASDRAAVIVRNLQSFSKSAPQYKEQSVTVPLDQALSLLSHELVKNSIEVVKDIQTVPEVSIDAGALSQVFLNLMINSIHAMPKGGKVQVKISSSSKSDGKPGIGIHIIDTGTGIPPEILPKIFDFAFSTKGNEGSGLGLSVSKEIVETHGGDIQVKSVVNQGTEFVIWLPLVRSNESK